MLSMACEKCSGTSLRPTTPATTPHRAVQRGGLVPPLGLDGVQRHAGMRLQPHSPAPGPSPQANPTVGLAIPDTSICEQRRADRAVGADAERAASPYVVAKRSASFAPGRMGGVRALCTTGEPIVAGTARRRGPITNDNTFLVSKLEP